MRIKTYIADDMPAALALVREAMGADAIIVSGETRADGTVRVVAAQEPTADTSVQEQDSADQVVGPKNDPEGGQPWSVIETALSAHGVPDPLVDQFAAAARDYAAVPPEIALAAICEDRLRFGGAPFRASLRPIVLVGPPGAGKTTTAAKLAAHARLGGTAVDLMAADMIKTAGIEQLSGLAAHIGLTIQCADNSAALAAGWRARRADLERTGHDVLAIVDTTGANPYDADDMARTAALIAGMRGHGVLVLPAGGDPLEQADTALAFAEIGATHLIVTRVDAARRLGCLLTAAAVRLDDAQLKLAGVGISPRIGNGLRPITPVSLARLLLAETAGEARDPFTASAREQSA